MSSRFTTDQLQRLEDAIAQGITKVSYADRHVSYRSLDEMLRLRELMKRSLNQDVLHSHPVVMTTSKGFYS
jgi:hypothetical protein